MTFVPGSFVVPTGMATEDFRLEPLRAVHNEPDYAAWTSSVDHIKATPGFDDWDWPDAALTIEDNLRDLDKHDRDFASRVGFTYTVLDPHSGDVIGCVYLYPSRLPGYDVSVRSWVRADRADLDVALWRAVSAWIAADWPFEVPRYAAR
jgi:hypothetical protein